MHASLMFGIGFVASLLMFTGDMLLYFTCGAYDMDGTLAPYARIMRDLPRRRVMAGALLGPIAAALYLVGFAAIALTARGDLAWMVQLAAGLLAFALICGGSYHAQYAYLQIAAQEGDDRLIDRVTDTIQPFMQLAVLPMYAGFILLAVGIVAGQTSYPVWFVFFTPVVTSFLGFVWLRIPQPVRCVLFGGWNNLVFAIMFAAMLVWTVCS